MLSHNKYHVISYFRISWPAVILSAAMRKCQNKVFIFFLIQRTTKNSPSKLEGAPEGGGSVPLLQRLFFEAWCIIR